MFIAIPFIVEPRVAFALFFDKNKCTHLFSETRFTIKIGKEKRNLGRVKS